MSIKNSKEKYRKNILDLRRSLPKNFFIKKSEYIQKKVIGFIKAKNIKSIGMYIPFNGEIDTQLILNFCLYHDINIGLPKINRYDKMSFFLFEKTNHLILSKYGFMTTNSSIRLEDKNMSFFLVPGIAFDKRGYRIGYGKGFYDKYFQRNPFSIKIGIAFNFQVYTSIPMNKYDHKISCLITDFKTYLF